MNRGPFWISCCLALCGLLTGCQTFHDDKVDAINNPLKLGGTSYRLEIIDPSGGVDKELGVLAVSSIKSALAARGLYEAPASVTPDMVIILEYGVGPGEIKIVYPSNVDARMGLGLMQDPSAKPILVFEKYLALSAREGAAPGKPTAQSGGRKHDNRGEEIWSVRVSVEDPKKDLAPYLVVLASSSIEYIGQNTGSEVHLQVDANGNAKSYPGKASSR